MPKQMDEKILQVAISGARRGGKILSSYFDCDGLECKLKEDKSFVTKADKDAEKAIIEEIRAHFPDHGILGEEGGAQATPSEYLWVIDPLDGTSNFVNGIPFFAVSIAVVYKGEPLVSLGFNPAVNFLFAAEKGYGTMLTGESV